MIHNDTVVGRESDNLCVIFLRYTSKNHTIPLCNDTKKKWVNAPVSLGETYKVTKYMGEMLLQISSILTTELVFLKEIYI